MNDDTGWIGNNKPNPAFQYVELNIGLEHIPDWSTYTLLSKITRVMHGLYHGRPLVFRTKGLTFACAGNVGMLSQQHQPGIVSAIYAASVELRQDCIAARINVAGLREEMLIGPRAAQWGEFDRSLFLSYELGKGAQCP